MSLLPLVASVSFCRLVASAWRSCTLVLLLVAFAGCCWTLSCPLASPRLCSCPQSLWWLFFLLSSPGLSPHVVCTDCVYGLVCRGFVVCSSCSSCVLRASCCSLVIGADGSISARGSIFLNFFCFFVRLRNVVGTGCEPPLRSRTSVGAF